MKKTNKKGFTLVELLVVIAILAILATVSVVGYLGFTQKARESKAQTELVQLRDVLTGYLLDSESTDKVYMNTKVGSIVVTLDEQATNEQPVIDAIVALAGTSDDLSLFTYDAITLKDGASELSYSGVAADEAGKYVFTITDIDYTVDGATASWNIADASVTVA